MTSLFLDSFVLQALVAGVGLSLITGPVGCLLLWRRLSFFGDAFAHTALLGVCLGVVLGGNLNLGIFMMCLLFVGLFTVVKRLTHIPIESWLAILSSLSLAGGIAVISKVPRLRIDPSSYLFGDLLLIDSRDLWWIGFSAIAVSFFIFWNWRSLLLATLDEELAQVSGISMRLLQTGFMMVLALTTAVCLKTIGALLVPAMLVIPAVSASLISKTPESMVFRAIGVSIFSTIVGIEGAIYMNIPSGSSIILTSGIILAMIGIWKTWRERRDSNPRPPA